MSHFREDLKPGRRMLGPVAWSTGILLLVLFGVFAARGYNEHFAGAREKLWRTLDILEQHATKVFVVVDVAARVVNDELLLLSDEEIATRKEALAAQLRSLADRLDELSNISVLDRNGHPVVLGREPSREDREVLGALARR